MKKKRIQNLDDYYLGDEPKYVGEILTKNDINLSRCLNWYSNLDNKKVYPWIKSYLSKDLTKQEISKIISTDSIIVRYLAIFLRMQANGTVFSGELSNLIANHLVKVTILSKDIKEEIDIIPKNVISIQQKILEKSRVLCAEIDEIFDNFFFNDLNSNFKAYEWLQKNMVSSQSTQYIIDVYNDIYEELTLVYEKTNEDLVEAYSHIPKIKIKKTIEFVNKILQDCEVWKNNKKQIRKPRKKKAISVEKQINSFKYMKEFTKYKLVSISPEQIIGSTQLWVFNTKYNYLTCYNSDSTFKIKGTTIQNIDLDTSIRKKCRKPEQTLSKVLTGGKIVLRKLMNELTTKPIEVNGRINQDCILLKAIK